MACFCPKLGGIACCDVLWSHQLFKQTPKRTVKDQLPLALLQRHCLPRMDRFSALLFSIRLRQFFLRCTMSRPDYFVATLLDYVKEYLRKVHPKTYYKKRKLKKQKSRILIKTQIVCESRRVSFATRRRPPSDPASVLISSARRTAPCGRTSHSQST